MPLELVNVEGPGNQIFAPGVGDSILELGLGDQSRKAFKVNPSDQVRSYKVVLEGTSFAMGLVPVRVKKGNKGKVLEGTCALKGPVTTEGVVNPFERVTTAETGTVGPCTYTVVTDPVTGEKDIGSTQGCTIAEKIDLADVEVKVNGEGGSLLFSEGLSVVVGSGTCVFRQFYPSNGPVFRFCW
jgi:hypothetical protein